MGTIEGSTSKIRKVGVTVWLLLAAALFAYVVGQHYPLPDWLVFRYGTYLALSAALLSSATLLGLAIVGRVAGPGLPFGERVAAALPVGLLAFVLVLMGLGFVGLIHPVLFFALPVTAAAVGIWGCRKTLRSLYRHRASWLALTRAGAGTTLLVACGAIGILLVYVPIVMPENISYDTRWYHMATGETYAATGRIFRFREGWMLGAMPQLASLLYAWCFLLPGALLFDHIELCAHLEFAVFLATLPGIGLVVRRVLPARQFGALAGWVFLFFFPGIYLYDSNLVAGADHIAALWAAPLFLAFLRAERALAVRDCLLFALLAVGLMHTKYTAFQLLVFPALALAARVAAALVRNARARRFDGKALLGPVYAGGVVLLLWTPHWLKNVLWYGNPFFPMAGNLFPSRPWVANAPARLSVLFAGSDWKPSRDWEGALRTARALFDFSFIPNDWDAFHGDVPVFGSLFTLALPLLFFLRKTKRLWALYGTCHAAVAFWFWTAHQDRYLQTTLPLMAAGTAAVLMATYRMGWLPRAGTVFLVALQLAWGADVPFLPTHTMMNESPFRAAVEFASSGYRGKRNERFDVLVHWQAMRDAIPKGSSVLVHEEPMHLGIGNRVVSDLFQTGLDYTHHASPDRMFDRLQRLGITHFIAPNGDSKKTDSFGADVAWNYFFKRHAVSPKRYGGFTLARMPQERPDASGFKDRVLFLGCEDTYASGIYTFADLDVPVRYGEEVELPPYPEPLQRVTRDDDPAPLYSEVDAVVHHHDCFPTPQVEASQFQSATSREGYRIWIRRKK